MSVRRLEAAKTTPSLQNPQTSFTNLLKWKLEAGKATRNSNMKALRRTRTEMMFHPFIVRGSRHPEEDFGSDPERKVYNARVGIPTTVQTFVCISILVDDMTYYK